MAQKHYDCGFYAPSKTVQQTFISHLDLYHSCLLSGGSALLHSNTSQNAQSAHPSHLMETQMSCVNCAD